jgi:dipeptidyl aminopeptidase/acylaminoacyl peptidase
LWDAATGEEIHTLKGHTKEVSSVSFSPDGTRIASGSHDQTIRLWDAATGEEIHTLKGHTKVAIRFEKYEGSSVSFSPDGTRIASGSNDRTIKLWDASTGEELHTLKGHTGDVRSVSFSPDGTRIASGSFDSTIRLWDAVTGEELHTLKGHRSSNWVWSVSFSPDGTRIASGSTDDTIRLWDAATGEELHTLKGPTGWVYSVSFSPDGTRIASGSGDKTIRLWDAATGEEIHTLKGHTKEVRSVSFSPDGTRLLSQDYKGQKLLWDLKSGAVLPGGNVDEFPAGNNSYSYKSLDGRWLAIPQTNDVLLVDLTYKKTPEERQRRKLLARLKPRWHRSQFQAAQSSKQWYAAVFHAAWLLKITPSGSVAEDAQGPFRQPAVTALMKKYDGDRNGVLSRKEVTGTPHELQFGHWDTNQDGRVSNRDIIAFRRRFRIAADGTRLETAAQWASVLHAAHRQLLAAHNGQSPPLPAVVSEMLKLPRGSDLPAEANN